MLRCQQMFQMQPEDLEVEWPPLRMLKATEEEQVKSAKQTRILERFDRQLETGQEASEELKKEGLLNVDTEVLRGEREVEPPLGAPELAGGGGLGEAYGKHKAREDAFKGNQQQGEIPNA
jgi:hypothetical protein